jgi:uncharacterized protein Yka (UPF0111/DUF47 family)
MSKDTSELIQNILCLAGEAIHLADQYAGGESESVEEFTKLLEKYEKIADKMEDKK